MNLQHFSHTKGYWHLISPTVSLLNHKLRSGELRQRSQIQGDPDCQTNHPCQHQRKCVEDSLKNTNVRV